MYTNTIPLCFIQRHLFVHKHNYMCPHLSEVIFIINAYINGGHTHGRTHRDVGAYTTAVIRTHRCVKHFPKRIHCVLRNTNVYFVKPTSPTWNTWFSQRACAQWEVRNLSVLLENQHTHAPAMDFVKRGTGYRDTASQEMCAGCHSIARNWVRDVANGTHSTMRFAWPKYALSKGPHPNHFRKNWGGWTSHSSPLCPHL